MPDPVTVNNDNPPADYTPPELDMATALPPEYRDKEFFKDKGFVDIVKEHVNLQELLGKRPAGIPKEDASDEEWGAFVNTLKPKEVTEYKFPETEFSKAGKRNEGYEKAIREMAAKVGVPKRQFNSFVTEIENHLSTSEQFSAQQTEEQQRQRDTEFEKLLDDTYKDKKSEVIERTKKMMAEAVEDPAIKGKVAEVLKDISNEHLFVLISVLDGIYKKHIAEDAPPGQGDNSSGDAASLQTQAETIMKSKAYNDFREAGHEEARQQVQDLFKQIASMKIGSQK